MHIRTEIDTTRFGPVEIRQDDVIRFPGGLPGLERCRDWVLLGDGWNNALAWLQSVDRPEIALPVVSPRRFVPDFNMRVARNELETLQFDDVRSAQVLVIVGRGEDGWTLNLKAPLVINLARRIGRQVITNGDLPVRHPLGNEQTNFKKSA